MIKQRAQPKGHEKGRGREETDELLLPEEYGKPSILLVGGGGHDPVDPGSPVLPALPGRDGLKAGQGCVPVVRCVIKRELDVISS